jgi:hypothetical protein
MNTQQSAVIEWRETDDLLITESLTHSTYAAHCLAKVAWS